MASDPSGYGKAMLVLVCIVTGGVGLIGFLIGGVIF